MRHQLPREPLASKSGLAAAESQRSDLFQKVGSINHVAPRYLGERGVELNFTLKINLEGFFVFRRKHENLDALGKRLTLKLNPTSANSPGGDFHGGDAITAFRRPTATISCRFGRFGRLIQYGRWTAAGQAHVVSYHPG